MDVTPKSFRDVEFRESKKGYHPDDVDEFLEQAAVGVEALHERLRQATERAQRAEQNASEGGTSDETLRRTLVLAQRTADLAVQESREQAQRILSAAEHQAHTLVAEAEERARRLHGEALADVHAELAKLELVRSQAQQEVDTLSRWAEEHRGYLITTLNDALAMVERSGLLTNTPPRSSPIDGPFAAPRPEVPRTEAPRVDVPRTETPRADVPRTEAPRSEPAWADPPAGENGRGEDNGRGPDRREPSFGSAGRVPEAAPSGIPQSNGSGAGSNGMPTPLPAAPGSDTPPVERAPLHASGQYADSPAPGLPGEPSRGGGEAFRGGYRSEGYRNDLLRGDAPGEPARPADRTEGFRPEAMTSPVPEGLHAAPSADRPGPTTRVITLDPPLPGEVRNPADRTWNGERPEWGEREQPHQAARAGGDESGAMLGADEEAMDNFFEDPEFGDDRRFGGRLRRRR